jgi:hypothetical protein
MQGQGILFLIIAMKGIPFGDELFTKFLFTLLHIAKLAVH